jgi:penicillin-insensitive murein endopeptidase
MGRVAKIRTIALFVTLAVVGVLRIGFEAGPSGEGRRPASLGRPELLMRTLDDPAVFSRYPEPSRDTPSPVGKYWAGCLLGGQELPVEGLGFRRMRLSRNRGYGHPTLVSFLRRFAKVARKEKLGDILVGDMSQPRGGPMPSGHRSHQMGLDADLWFRTLDAAFPPLESHERERWGAPSMVAPNGRDPHPKHWTSVQARLLEIAAGYPEVERIFVNPVIKKELCRTRRGEAWLAKVRPYFGHDAHFHVRLRCPNDGADCIAQRETPVEGDGCGNDLAGWFLADGRVKPAPPSKKESVFEVPSKCLASLDEASPR